MATFMTIGDVGAFDGAIINLEQVVRVFWKIRNVSRVLVVQFNLWDPDNHRPFQVELDSVAGLTFVRVLRRSIGPDLITGTEEI